MIIDGLVLRQGQNLGVAADILKRLKIGDILKARVLTVNKDEILLKLLDGTTLKASTAVDLNAFVGEMLEFIVKNKNGRQLVLERASVPLSRNPAEAANTGSIVKTKITNQDIEHSNANTEQNIFKFFTSGKSGTAEQSMDILFSIFDENFHLGNQLKQLTELVSNFQNGKGADNAHDETGEAMNMPNDDFFVNIKKDMKASELDISKLYEKIKTKLEELKTASQAFSSAVKDEIVAKTDNIKNTIDFIESMNRNNIYVQIPVIMSNNKSTAELYIIRERHARNKTNSGEIWMVVSLKTMNLGQVDSFIRLNGRNLDIIMRVNNEKAMNIIKNNNYILYTSLSEKNYKLLSLNCRISDEKVDPANLHRLIESELIRNKTSIDYVI